ncbi:MAG: SLOG family protein [Clostridia bacterium]|nr:SLOG family protein [Clostridia bacterium]
MENTVRRPIAEKARRCAFTGYRPLKMPFEYDEQCDLALDFKKRLRETLEVLILQGYTHMISGGAQGMDLMAAETVLDLRERYPHVTLEMAVPFEAQAEKWDADYRARWQRCIDGADMITVLSHEYHRGCMYARNRYLVTQADLLLACYDGLEGGTRKTIDYARRNGVAVCTIPPVKTAKRRGA